MKVLDAVREKEGTQGEWTVKLIYQGKLLADDQKIALLSKLFSNKLADIKINPYIHASVVKKEALQIEQPPAA